MVATKEQEKLAQQFWARHLAKGTEAKTREDMECSLIYNANHQRALTLQCPSSMLSWLNRAPKSTLEELAAYSLVAESLGLYINPKYTIQLDYLVAPIITSRLTFEQLREMAHSRGITTPASSSSASQPSQAAPSPNPTPEPFYEDHSLEVQADLAKQFWDRMRAENREAAARQELLTLITNVVEGAKKGENWLRLTVPVSIEATGEVSESHQQMVAALREVAGRLNYWVSPWVLTWETPGQYVLDGALDYKYNIRTEDGELVFRNYPLDDWEEQLARYDPSVRSSLEASLTADLANGLISICLPANYGLSRFDLEMLHPYRLIAKSLDYQLTPFKVVPCDLHPGEMVIQAQISGTPKVAPAAPQPTANPTAIVLGTDLATGLTVSLSQAARQLGVYIIGSPGMGKSTLMLNMILHDIDMGKGLCVLDPNGDLLSAIIARRDIPKDRVILLDPNDEDHPFGLNLFECLHPESRAFRSKVAGYVLAVFLKIWGPEGLMPAWGTNIDDLLRHISQTFVQATREDPGPNFGAQYTLVDIPRFLDDEGFREQVIRNVRPTLQEYWRHTYAKRADRSSYTSPTLTRVQRFTDNEMLAPILGQSRSTINISNIMDAGKILLVRLPAGEVDPDAIGLLGNIIISQFLQSMLARMGEDASERRPFSLYGDEFYYYATDDFESFFSQARKFNFYTTVAHQHRDQLDSSSQAATMNVRNKVVFNISAADAQALRREFSYKSTGSVMPVRDNPLEDLLATPHVNPQVKQFVELYLRPDMTVVKQIDRSNHEHGLELKSGYRSVGQLLVSIMTDGGINSRHESLFKKIIQQFAHAKGVPEQLIDYDAMSQHSRDRDLHRALLDAHTGLQRGTVDPYHFADIEERIAELREEAKREDAEAKRKVKESAEQRKLYQQDVENLVLDKLWKTIISGEDIATSDGWLAWQQIQTKYGLAFSDGYIQFLSAFMDAAKVLAADPLLETNVLGLKPDADIVNILSHLPEHQALVKLQEGGRIYEGLVAMANAPEPVETSVFEQRRAAIYAYAHQHYTTSVDEVEADLQKRWQWRSPKAAEQPKPGTSEPSTGQDKQSPPRKRPLKRPDSSE